ncbi:TPA: toxin [Candidatus Collierbacteria bacterium]|nr:toxin [Candidatus Collierbacteria bacterium]HCX25850.1 toxin [Candidatus Collierbacteria bacterium]
MKFDWNPDKNKLLKLTRGIDFQSIVRAIKKKKVLLDTPHFDQIRYPKQRILIISIKSYAYIVPYVQNGPTRFLKTIYPSRRYYKKYLKNAQKAKIRSL